MKSHKQLMEALCLGYTIDSAGYTGFQAKMNKDGNVMIKVGRNAPWSYDKELSRLMFEDINDLGIKNKIVITKLDKLKNYVLKNGPVIGVIISPIVKNKAKQNDLEDEVLCIDKITEHLSSNLGNLTVSFYRK